MSDDNAIKAHLERLRGQRQARAGQDSASRDRPGLRALMMAAAPVAGTAGGESRSPGGLDAILPDGRGVIAHLLKNPDIRHALLQWLQHQESGATRPAGGENAWGLEFGDTLPHAEELTTSSTLEEITRYHQQLKNRVDWLEAALEETLLEMERVSRFKLAASEVSKAEEPLAPPADPLL